MIVRSLAFQIGTRLPDYRKILLKLLQIHRIEKMSPGHLFTFLIAEPLRNAIDGNRDRYLIVIDALDEAGESGNNELVRTLAENLAQLPRWIGILVTSRPESRIVSKFQSMKMVSVDAGANLNLDDIRDYLRLELQNELSGSSAPEEIIESIVEKSEGVFMYAECFCREVHRGLQSLNGPVGFPQGLSALYSRDFERQFTDADDFGKELLPALRAILAAREPLPLHLLQKAIDCSDEDLATLIRKLGTFFPVSVESGKRVIKVFHKSLGDWLTDADFAGDYFVSRREGHKLFIELLWPYRLQHPDISQCHGYPAKHLAGHLIAAGDWSRFEQLLHDSLEVWLNYWVEGGGGTDGRACISSFLTAVDDGEIVTSATLKLVLSNQMARLLAQVGYYPEAMTMIRERVLPHCSVWHRRKQRAIAEHEIGSLYFYDNDESGAVSSYRRALLIALFGLPVYWGEVAANAVGLASLCIPAGKFRTVQGWCLLAGVASWRSSDWPHRIAALRLRARAAMELGRYQIADKVLKRASEMSERQNVMHELVRVQLQRAWLCLDLFTLHETHLSTCRELFEQAEVLAESCGFTFEYWEARIGRCWAALAESETALASEFAAPLRALAETTHDVHLARRLITLGAIRHQQHAHEEACRLYRKGIQAAERQSCPVWKRMGMIAIGAIHWHSESQDQAKTIWSSVTSDAERFSVAHRQLCIQAINRCRRSAESVPTSA
ncbi:MAG: hypothetical protein KDA81_15455 [Planctomycetaceae bacterium]|nr:hypothetical protein [Planctomycetaceae bacterium]